MFKVACSVVVPNVKKVSLRIMVAVAVRYAVVVVVEMTDTSDMISQALVMCAMTASLPEVVLVTVTGCCDAVVVMYTVSYSTAVLPLGARVIEA